MAKRIILAFSDNPLVGTGLNIGVYINSLPILFDNGEVYLSIDFTGVGVPDVVPNSCELKTDKNDSIDKILAFLNVYWVTDFITYSRVNDTIVMLIQADDLAISIGDINPNISATIQDVDEAENLNLRYFFEYTNNQNDTFLCQIFKRYYLGGSTYIRGKATLDKGSVKSHTDSIRGTGLSLDLEASTELTLEDLYTDNEQDFTVRFYKNGKIMFMGFLKPDGVFQSFTSDSWIITLDCVDGLGALSNLSFVQESGFRFVGRMKASDIVYYCLKRTGISLPINTAINTLYDGLTPTQNLDILTKIYLSADRFFKEDSQTSGDGTLMSCEEVLKSVLDIFRAVITQENGEWYIYKPNEVYRTPYVLFRRYDIANVFIGVKTVNLAKVLGSQTENFYPHHCSADQRIEIKGGVSAFRLGYKYGFVSGLLPNPDMIHDGNLNFAGWTIQYPGQLVNDPTSTSGMIIKNGNPGLVVYAKSVNLGVLQGDLLTLKVAFKVSDSFFSGKFLHLRIQVGSYYLSYSPRNDQTPFQDAIDKTVWSPTLSTWTIYVNQEGSFEFPIPAMPVDGNLTFQIDFTSGPGGTTTIKSFDTAPTQNAKAEIGEFHTVSRSKKISSIVKENLSVSNGDNNGLIYTGVIMKEDQVTPTSTWSREGSFESLPLLRIAAEDELRIGQKPLKVFSGSVFGFIPFLSLVSIDNVDGVFMAIDYSYDTERNIGKFKLLELYAPEISDILYKFTFDYGNTVKPTITS